MNENPRPVQEGEPAAQPGSAHPAARIQRVLDAGALSPEAKLHIAVRDFLASSDAFSAIAADKAFLLNKSRKYADGAFGSSFENLLMLSYESGTWAEAHRKWLGRLPPLIRALEALGAELGDAPVNGTNVTWSRVIRQQQEFLSWLTEKTGGGVASALRFLADPVQYLMFARPKDEPAPREMPSPSFMRIQFQEALQNLAAVSVVFEKNFAPGGPGARFLENLAAMRERLQKGR